MDAHVRIVGGLNIAFGVASAVIGLFLLLQYGGPLGMSRSIGGQMMGMLAAVSASFHLLLAIPCVVGGVGLRSFSQWSRGVLIMTSGLNLLNIPVGSLLGIYGLWVLLAEETEPLFNTPPVSSRR